MGGGSKGGIPTDKEEASNDSTRESQRAHTPIVLAPDASYPLCCAVHSSTVQHSVHRDCCSCASSLGQGNHRHLLASILVRQARLFHIGLHHLLLDGLELIDAGAGKLARGHLGSEKHLQLSVRSEIDSVVWRRMKPKHQANVRAKSKMNFQICERKQKGRENKKKMKSQFVRPINSPSRGRRTKSQYRLMATTLLHTC